MMLIRYNHKIKRCYVHGNQVHILLSSSVLQLVTPNALSYIILKAFYSYCNSELLTVCI